MSRKKAGFLKILTLAYGSMFLSLILLFSVFLGWHNNKLLEDAETTIKNETADFILKNQMQTFEDISKVVTELSVAPVSLLDLESLRYILEQNASHRLVKYIYVINAGGTYIIKRDKFMNKDFGLKVEDPLGLKAMKIEKTGVIHENIDTIDIASPVMLEDKRLGTILIGFDATEIKNLSGSINKKYQNYFSAELSQNLMIIIVSSTFLLTAALFITSFIGRFFVTKVLSLVDLSEKISSEDKLENIDFDCSEIGIYELEKLAESLLKTSEIISNREKQLIASKDYLEYKVAVRTIELENTTDMLSKEVEKGREREKRLQVLANVYLNSNEAIVITDVKGNILQVNPAFEKITGYIEDEILNENCSIIKSNRHEKDFYFKMWKTLASKASWTGEIWNRKKDGSIYPAILSVKGIKDEHGSIEYFVGIQHDIS